MPSLKGYSSDLEYSYAPGVFPSLELMRVRPESAMRLLLSERAQGEGVEKLRRICRENGVREEIADKALRRISSKDNCFAAVVFEKWQAELEKDKPHVVLHHVSDGLHINLAVFTVYGRQAHTAKTEGGELAFLKIVIQHCLSSAYCSMISASTLAVSSARFSML